MVRDHQIRTTQLPASAGLPTWLAYDGRVGAFYVAETNSTVSVIPAGSTQVAASIRVGVAPFGVAYDPTGGRVFVANSGSNSVSVISDATDTVVTSIDVGNRPYGLAYDSLLDRLFVTNGGSNTLSIIDTQTLRVVNTVPVGLGPVGVAYDPVSGNVFVANQNSGTASVLSAATDALVGTIAVGTGPYGVAADTSTGEVYVANSQSGNVTVLTSSGGATVATITVGGTPEGLAYDSANRSVWVADGAIAIVVIQTADHRVLQDILNDPMGAAYDPDRSQVCVTNSGNGTFQCLTPSRTFIGYNVTFNESGLPVGVRWAVTLDGGIEPAVLQESTRTAVQLVVVGPAYWGFAIAPVSGFSARPSSGDLRQNVTIVFTPDPGSFVVSFVEQGLVFSPWTVLTWGVVLPSGPPPVTTAQIGVAERNGTYGYSLRWVEGYSRPSPTEFTVSGRDLTVRVNYTLLRYAITFQESGLAPGVRWSVSLNGTLQYSVSGSISFAEPSGDYHYAVGSVPGYPATPASGNLTVAAGNLTVSLTFTPSTFGISNLDWLFIVGGLGALAAVGVSLSLVRRRAGRVPSEPGSRVA